MREKRPALVITFPTHGGPPWAASPCASSRGLPRGERFPGARGEVAARLWSGVEALPADEELLRGELAAAGVPTEAIP